MFPWREYFLPHYGGSSMLTFWLTRHQWELGNQWWWIVGGMAVVVWVVDWRCQFRSVTVSWYPYDFSIRNVFQYCSVFAQGLPSWGFVKLGLGQQREIKP